MPSHLISEALRTRVPETRTVLSLDGSQETPAVFRPSDVTFYFRHTLTQGVADSQFTWTGAGANWLPVAGQFGLG